MSIFNWFQKAKKLIPITKGVLPHHLRFVVLRDNSVESWHSSEFDAEAFIKSNYRKDPDSEYVMAEVKSRMFSKTHKEIRWQKP